MPNIRILQKKSVGINENSTLDSPKKIPLLGKVGSFLSAEDVVSRIKVPDIKVQPETLLVCATCRSGTTALYCAFAQVIPSFYQPIKAIVRGGLPEFSMPAVPRFFMKETFGTAFIEEVEFDPFQILLSAGMCPKKIHPVFLIRDPLTCFDSWKRRMAGAKLELFGAAFCQVLKLYEKSLTAGANPMILEYEDLTSNPRQELSWLAKRLRFDINNQMLGWSDGVLPFGIDPNPDFSERSVVLSSHRRSVDETLSHRCIAEMFRSPSTLTFVEKQWIKEKVYPLYEALRLNKSSGNSPLPSAQFKTSEISLPT